MRTLTITTALAAALGLAACQPAAEGTESADAGAATAEGAAQDASASGGETVNAGLRAGLWQITNTVGGVEFVSRMCADETMSALSTTVDNQAGTDCDQTVDQSADSLSFSSVCRMGGEHETRTQGTITGDRETAYRMEATVTTTGAPVAAMNGTQTLVTDAVHQGACPAGWRGGDIEATIMGNTVRTNVHDTMARGAAEAAARGG